MGKSQTTLRNTLPQILALLNFLLLLGVSLPMAIQKFRMKIFLMFLMKDGMCLPIIEDSASTGKLSNMLHSQHDTKI